MVIEFANKKWGSFLLSNLYMSFAIGGMIISAVAAATIVDYGWHFIFWFAGTFHLVIFVACLFLMPESLSFLLAKHPKNALARANKLLAKLDREPLTELPPRTDLGKKPQAPVVQILTKSLFLLSILLWVSSFAHFFSAALTGGLQAKILVDMGLSIQAPASAVGVLLMGILASKYDPLKLTIGAIAMATLGHFAFGFVPPVVSLVYANDAFIGFFHAAVFAGTLMYVAKRYPPEVRGTGIGWTIGIGRLGTMTGTAFGGVVIGAQWDRPVMFSIMAAVCAIGGLAIWATTWKRPAPNAVAGQEQPAT
jgi:MFS family permease